MRAKAYKWALSFPKRMNEDLFSAKNLKSTYLYTERF